MDGGWSFDNSYARLPSRFFSEVRPEPSPSPELIRLNEPLAESLGLEVQALAGPAGLEILAGQRTPKGAASIATAYAGHQFGHFNPQLGDGRALLLGELVSGGERFDVQLKGSGRTPYSRGGDGKAPLGPVLREYVVSEAMAALGVPTTRSLAAVATGETVVRDRARPGGLLTRVARSHIRVGTFEFFAARDDLDGLRALIDHVLERHYPELREAVCPPLALLGEVMARQARLVAHWQSLGFIHGVMNTDNVLISGETIDYGPCAFLDAFQADKVFSSIDHGGRYAFSKQPGIAHWNMARFAQALLPLIDEDQDRAIARAQEALEPFPGLFTEAWRARLADKLGLGKLDSEDEALTLALFETMQRERLDFTQTFDGLRRVTEGEEPSLPELGEWLPRWRARLEADDVPLPTRRARMRHANPAIIPRNHLVEAALSAAEEGEFQPFHDLVDALLRPYETHVDFARPPRSDELVAQTFCGT
ncbi:MAG: YdiU family protein [Myxococcota bacterium]